MRVTLVIDTDKADDAGTAEGRKLVADYLNLISVGIGKYVALDAREGDIRGANGVAVGHWKIDP